MPQLEQASSQTLDFEAIKNLIPQRFPFLMLDRVVELVPGERIVGIKCLTGNEWFYQGHFPSKAITPGAMLLEAIAQTAIILFRFSFPERDDVTYLLGGAKIRFLEPAFPGTQINIEVTPVKLASKGGIFNARVSANARTICKAEVTLGMKRSDAW